VSPDPSQERAPVRGLASPAALALIACFFVSGAASLVLEVVWTRGLRLVFGSTTLAVSTVLVAYMAGLGAGGLVGGRLAARSARPVRAYGWIELGIGLYALAVPFLIAALPALAGAWLAELPFWPAALVRFAVALALLAPPTFGMGLTLPLITRALVVEARAGGGIAVLYGVNTLGAVAGVLLATFALLPALGVRTSSVAAAAVDLAVGALALLLARRFPALEREAPPPAPARELSARWNPALLAYATVGFSALVYEVAWTRALAMVMGSSLYAFACMLAAFLFGIGAGSLAARGFVDRLRRPLFAYALGIALLGVVSLVCLVALPALPALFMRLVRASGGSPGALAFAQFGTALLVMLPPALVLGALFPLLARVQASVEGAASATGDVYFANTAGSALGAFLAGFVLLPALGLRGTAALAIAINALACAGLLLWRGHDTFARRAALAAAPLALAAWMVAAPPSIDTRPLAFGGFSATRIFDATPDVSVIEGIHDEEVLFYRDGLSATVSVHRYRGGVSLHTNGKADASSNVDMPTQVLIGQVPMLFGPPAKSALVIGWASGVTAGSIARHPVERIDVVELEPAMLEASRFFDDVNGRPLEDPRLRMIVDDGRSYLARTTERYDVIASEPSNPWLTGVANLFTREHFRAARNALAPGGRLLQWFPLYAIDPEILRSVLAALRAEFPHVYAVLIDRRVPDLLLLATTEALRREDLPVFEELPESVRSDLERVGTRSTADLWSLLRLLPADVDALIGPHAVPNTDDNLFVELRSPWLLYADDFADDGSGPGARSAALIDAFKLGEWPLVEPAAAERDLDPGELALSHIRARRDRAVAESLAQIGGDSGPALAARAELDRLEFGLDVDEYRARLDTAVAAAPDSFAVRMVRARARLATNDADGALEDVARAAELRPDDASAALLHASILIQLGRSAEAWNALQPVLASESGKLDPIAWLLAGRAGIESDRIAEGLPWLERYVQAEPGQVSAWQLLETAYTAQSRVADAGRARRNQSTNLYLIALGAERDGDAERARATLRRALDLTPEHEPSRAALARLGG
jgi:spermidine synthase